MLLKTQRPSTYANEYVYLIIATLFISSMAIINVLSTSRFIQFSLPGLSAFEFTIPVGLLPYPLTFLCTDVVCELYGKKRASQLVALGFLANVWVFFVMWGSGLLPNVPPMAYNGELPNPLDDQFAFYRIRQLCLTSIGASMLAYLVAQNIDVALFHTLKKWTRGKHLWLRNNVSTMSSQFVDTLIVLSVCEWITHSLPIDPNLPFWGQFFSIVFSCYLLKCLMALSDTLPCYLLVALLRKRI